MTARLTLLIIWAAAALALDVPASACLNSVEGVCTQCDTSQFYYLQFGACHQYEGLHCTQIDQGGSCMSCEAGFLLSKTASCIYVENRVPNCAFYTDEAGYIQCAACSSGFILVRASCFPETPNCQTYYPGRNRCQVCKEGYQLSKDRFSCVPVSAQGQ